MVMQQLSFHDDVTVEYMPSDPGQEGCGTASGDGGSFDIEVSTNRYYLPVDRKNLAYQAAELMAGLVSENGGKAGGSGDKTAGSGSSVHVAPGTIRITIKKRIPVAAGLAGGSGNGAAVLHGINVLWGMDLSLEELCGAGARLGSDVPFCVMGQAAENDVLKDRFATDHLACHCALATGTGTDLEPLKGLESHIVLSKPPISVSTAKAYQGIDSIEIPERPDTEELIEGLKTKDYSRIEKNMVNVLENYTLKEYPTVVYTKNKMQEMCAGRAVLMSGSGPSVYGLTGSIKESRAICAEMAKINRESFWTRTTF